MITISEARTGEQLDAVRRFMCAFVAWVHALSPQDAALVDMYFQPTEFEAELAALPGRYARPSGQVLIASIDGEPAGCVALRSLADGVCEMKRMYVDPRHHGRGVGRRLAETLIARAQDMKYRVMRLDTSRNQLPAIRLYESLGFKRIAPYYPVPPEFKDFLLYFERDLGDAT